MEKKSRTGTIIGIGAGCLFLCLFVVVGGVIWLLAVTEPPEGITIDLVVPDEVRINEEIIIEISIQNTLPKSRVLKEVEIDATYLDGIFVHDSRPAFYDAWDDDNKQTYSFDIDIPPNGSETVELDATAIQAGTFTGQVEICIDSVLSCFEYPVLTRVRQQ